MTERPATVGVVGLGMMGGGIAVALLDAGLDVVVTDVDPSTRDRDGRFAQAWRVDAAAIARDADVVFIVVLDAAQTEAVLFGEGGIARSGAAPVVATCATLDVDVVRELADRAGAVGLDLIDVGIAGGPDAAATGDLVTTVGGSDIAVARAAAALDAMSSRTIHGGDIGSGMELKLIKNAISYMTMNAVHEGLLLAEELGYPSDLVAAMARDTNLVDHFFWFPAGRPSARPLPADSPVRSPNEHFSRLADKDLAAAASLADGVGLAHPTIDLARARARTYFLVDE